MELSPWVALALLLIAVLLLAGALWASIRGLGGYSTLRSEVIVLQTALEAINERMTREVKTRAAQAGVAKREEEASLLEQSRVILAQQAATPAPPGRPRRPARRG